MGGAQIVGWLVEHITLFLVPLLVWMTKTMLKVSQTLYGERGDNGLKADVQVLRAARHGTMHYLQNHHARLHELDQKHTDELDPAQFQRERVV